MNIIREIKQFFERRKALKEVYDDLKNLNEVKLEQRIKVFNEIVTPRLAEIGLKNWNGKYIWFSDFNEEGVKHVVEYNVFKYFGGSFSFGNCYNFIPTISGRKLIFHKTDKSTKIIYYKKSEGWQKSDDEDSPINIDHISTVNEEKFHKSLNEVLDRNLPKFEKWFEQNESIEQNIKSLLKDVEHEKKEFIRRIISFDYILYFLYRQKGNKNEAEKHFKQHIKRNLNSPEEIELLKEKN
ncbi:MAG: hypothetical protein O9267_05350 [Flavobacterium sp.]|uniref:hypothetical protein n=1 Tax=Flavobacterium sp. TaxID=239 RepID=UPI0022C91B41|nr:hypothetical protein [Flavobacterium sp.]MCZ8197010.1 hypothetical protein [Flavobacterium sp.]